MLDAVVSGASVFEPNEAAALREAYAQVRRRVREEVGGHASLPTLLVNLANTRLRLKKSLAQPCDVRELAEEAVEVHEYLQSQNVDLSASDAPRPAARSVGLFPASFAAPVRTSFRDIR